jgi:hypothetical protein
LAAHFFLGSIALALVTLALFRLGIDLASIAFAYLIVIVALAGGQLDLPFDRGSSRGTTVSSSP